MPELLSAQKTWLDSGRAIRCSKHFGLKGFWTDGSIIEALHQFNFFFFIIKYNCGAEKHVAWFVLILKSHFQYLQRIFRRVLAGWVLSHVPWLSPAGPHPAASPSELGAGPCPRGVPAPLQQSLG